MFKNTQVSQSVGVLRILLCVTFFKYEIKLIRITYH